MATQVMLELDEKDKENFTELQQSMSQAQQELGRVNAKMQHRTREGMHAKATLSELAEMGDETVSYRQVGKMFLQEPIAKLKEGLAKKAEDSEKEAAALAEQKTHIEGAFKKVQEDFQEFIRNHMISQQEAAAAKAAKEGGKKEILA